MDRQQAARALGMKTREITAVDRIGDGWVVTTHDGQRTAVNAAGEVLGRGDHLAAGSPPTGPGEVEQPTPQTPDPTEAEVPAGTVQEVLAWVEQAPTSAQRAQRAQVAAAVEAGRDQPRSTLVDALDKARVDALAAQG